MGKGLEVLAEALPVTESLWACPPPWLLSVWGYPKGLLTAEIQSSSPLSSVPRLYGPLGNLFALLLQVLLFKLPPPILQVGELDTGAHL